MVSDVLLDILFEYVASLVSANEFAKRAMLHVRVAVNQVPLVVDPAMAFEILSELRKHRARVSMEKPEVVTDRLELEEE